MDVNQPKKPPISFPPKHNHKISHKRLQNKTPQDRNTNPLPQIDTSDIVNTNRSLNTDSVNMNRLLDPNISKLIKPNNVDPLLQSIVGNKGSLGDFGHLADSSSDYSLDSDANLKPFRSGSNVSILGDLANKSYVDSELEKHVFTYGPYMPTRISQGSVPRPQALPLGDVSGSLYETGKTFGLIPTFGNHKIMDFGSASPIYMTPTFTQVPIFGSTLSDMRLPFGVSVQPFAENCGFTLPELDFLAFMEKRSSAKRDLIRCRSCHSYYSAYLHQRGRAKTRVCNFCGTTFELTDEQLEALERINSQFRENSPLKRGSIDYIAPKHYYTKDLSDMGGDGGLSGLMSRASIGFKSQTRQESFIYDTFSVSPIPVDSAQAQEVVDPVDGVDYRVVDDVGEGSEVRYPTYSFIIESTSHSNRLGVRESVITAIMNALNEIEDEVFQLGVFLFDSVLYSFSLGQFNTGDSVLSQLGVNVVSEVEENFKPFTSTDMYLTVARDTIDSVKEYLLKILSIKTLRISPNSCANFALSSVLRVMDSEGLYGTVCIFYVTQPDVGLGTDPETFPKSSFILTEIQRYFYDSLLQLCYNTGICVDVFLCPPETRIPGDIALQYISQQTGGNVVYLPRFTQQFDYFKIYHDITRLFKVEVGYKCELKLRCSKHIKISEVLSSFNNSRAVKNTSTLIIPRIGPELSIGFNLNLNHMVDNKTSLYLQAACLYTSVRGSQKLRVHTQCLKVISSINEVFKNTNPDAIMNLMSRKMAKDYIRNGKFNREKEVKMIVDALTAYRHICAPSTPKNQLILPDNLKFLPAYLNSLLKYNVSGEFGFEFVIKLLKMLNGSPKVTYFLYTRTYGLHRSINEKGDSVPENGFKFELDAVGSAGSFIYSDGIYLLDDGYRLLLFIGPHVKNVILHQLFGKNYQFPHVVLNSMELIDTPTTKNLLNIVDEVRKQHKGCPYLPLKIMTYTAKNSKIIKTLLLEDEMEGEPSYINFLVHVHRAIIESCEKIY